MESPSIIRLHRAVFSRAADFPSAVGQGTRGRHLDSIRSYFKKGSFILPRFQNHVHRRLPSYGSSPIASPPFGFVCYLLEWKVGVYFFFFLKTVNVKQPLWPFEEPQDLLHRNQELSNDAAIRQRLKRVIRYKQKLPCLFDLLQSSWLQKKAIFTDFATRHFQKDNTRCFRRRTTHYFTGFCYI